MSQIVFTSAKRTSIFGDWFRNAKVGGRGLDRLPRAVEEGRNYRLTLYAVFA